VPFYRNTDPSLSVTAPRGGYVIPAAYALLISEKLALHGLKLRTLAVAAERTAVQAFRAARTDFSCVPFEGRMTLKLQGKWCDETHDIPAGSVFAPIDQPRARLLMALLEPLAPDSLAAWGFFNGCFEQKEYIEPYVAEIIALEMLSSDPALTREFQNRLANDPAFAGNPAARREFFHRRHGSWDERSNLYPVLKSGRQF
jgi:hypothetical protein